MWLATSTCDCYELGRRPGYSVTKLSGQFTGLRRPGDVLQRRIPFSRLPKTVLDNPHSSLSVPLSWGRWAFRDHITLGDSRAVVRLVRGVASCAAGHRAKIISLQDNMATAGSNAKGRSAAPAVNFLLRQKAGSCLAAEIFTVLPWVQTTAMPADGLSRMLSPVGPPEARPASCSKDY